MDILDRRRLDILDGLPLLRLDILDGLLLLRLLLLSMTIAVVCVCVHSPQFTYVSIHVASSAWRSLLYFTVQLVFFGPHMLRRARAEGAKLGT
jgi:hypothetical protein